MVTLQGRFGSFFLFLALFLISTGWAAGEPKPEGSAGKGVLVVTYNTGRNGERLDRVRFRLVNEQKEQMIYPRAGTFFESAGRHTRRVTIPNLAAGRYTIEFIIPNTDGLFPEVPQRQITVAAGSIVKIDQTLKPHYARIKATAVIPDIPGAAPGIRLSDRRGSIIATAFGELVTTNLLPGHYTLRFDAYRDYQAPDPIKFSVKAGAVVGPFERYYQRISKDGQVSNSYSYYQSKMAETKSLRLPIRMPFAVETTPPCCFGNAHPEPIIAVDPPAMSPGMAADSSFVRWYSEEANRIVPLTGVPESIHDELVDEDFERIQGRLRPVGLLENESCCIHYHREDESSE